MGPKGKIRIRKGFAIGNLTVIDGSIIEQNAVDLQDRSKSEI
jgi:hypothetical protein